MIWICIVIWYDCSVWVWFIHQATARKRVLLSVNNYLCIIFLIFHFYLSTLGSIHVLSFSPTSIFNRIFLFLFCSGQNRYVYWSWITTGFNKRCFCFLLNYNMYIYEDYISTHLLFHWLPQLFAIILTPCTTHT